MMEDNGMKKTLYIAIAFAALFAVSCQKEKELHPVGSRIVFSAATEFMNALETRTIYTGEYAQITSGKYERIQWVANDPITILYNHGSSSSANYTIDGNSISGSGTAKKSTASINASGTALTWGEGNSHIFYGLYPTGAGSLTAGSVTGLVMPTTQTVTWNSTQKKYLPTMTNAFMVAYKDMSNDQNSTVNLPFTPIVNAIEFQLHLPDDRPSYTVTQVKFSHASTAIAGTYNVNITGFANDAVTWAIPNNGIPSNTASTGIVVNFSPANPSVPTSTDYSTNDNVLDFSVLTLPVAISDPVLQIKYSDGHVLKLTLTGLSLQPGQKCIVTNGKAGHDHFYYEISSPSSQQWDGHVAHTFANIPVTTSVKRSRANNSYTENVTWKVQSQDVNQNWFDGIAPGFNGFTVTEDHTNNTFSVGFPAAGTFTDNTMTAFDAATEILQKRDPLSSARDLSLYDVAGNSLGSRTTANCYVVSRPGTYRIPFYYGNAVVGGNSNPSAYNPGSVSAISTAWGSGGTDETQNYYLPQFYNAAGELITSPNIITDITNSHYHRVGTLTAQVTWFDSFRVTPTVSGNGANDYIQFTITPENIKPGNILIQLESSEVGGNWPVIWSWHIWVTDRDLTPQSGVMPVNLGWVDADEIVPGAVTRYQDQTLTFRLAQVENGVVVNTSDEFTLSTKGEVVSVENNRKGQNPHFQWGRKDPFPADANHSTVMIMKHSDTGYDPQTQTVGNYAYFRGIRTPNVMLEGEKSLTWMDGPAIPLYKRTATGGNGRYIWTIKTGHEKYGPFTTQQKNLLVPTTFTPSGASWIERMTTPVLQHYITKSNSVNQPIPGADIVTLANWLNAADPSNTIDSSYWQLYDAQNNYWVFKSGKVFSVAQKNYYDAHINEVTNAFTPLGLNCINAFMSNCLDGVYSTPQGTGQWDLSLPNGVLFPYGPHAQEVADILLDPLNQTGATPYIMDDFTWIPEPVSYSYSYTTDAERSAGSILYNLWSAALYNETASVTKYKTVYDPCPVGFAVPTIETYLGSSWASQVGNNKEVTGLAAMQAYPQSSARINDLNCAVNGTANSPLYTGTPAKGFYWTDRPCNMEVVNSANKHTIDGYQYHTDSYILMTEYDWDHSTGTSTVSHYNRRAAASIRPMRDPGSNIYPAATASPGNVGGGLEGVSTGTNLY